MDERSHSQCKHSQLHMYSYSLSVIINYSYQGLGNTMSKACFDVISVMLLLSSFIMPLITIMHV